MMIKIPVKYFLFILLFSCVIFSCKKDPELISSTPEITFVSLTPATVKEYKDSMVFTISYRDGDGDLGENNAAAENLFLTDTRNNVTYKFRIPQLAPDASSIAIQGKLDVILNNTGITDGSASQTFTYNMYVKDRSGKQSNTVTTSAVTVIQ
jgi:hypothetical protein